MTTTSGMKPLNTTDGWEDIVNGNARTKGTARDRVAIRRKARRAKKLLLSACGMGAGTLAAVTLGTLTLLNDSVAAVLSILLSCAGFLFLGMYMEGRK